MRIALRPAGTRQVQNPDRKLTFRIARVPLEGITPAVAGYSDDGEPLLVSSIGAGADMFADATLIAFRPVRDAFAAYTYNKAFSAEIGEPQTVTGTPAQKTAWWTIVVPAGSHAWLSVDLQMSFGNSGNPDTQLAVFWLPEPGGLGDLTRLASNEDTSVDWYYSRLENIYLNGSLSGDPDGTRFYIQAGDFHNGAPGICYVLRVTLRRTAPGSIPAGGHDPDA